LLCRRLDAALKQLTDLLNAPPLHPRIHPSARGLVLRLSPDTPFNKMVSQVIPYMASPENPSRQKLRAGLAERVSKFIVNGKR
jgi:hypothetical protein